MKTSELMMKFLKEQGLMPQEMDGGHIYFKYQMCSFYYVNYEDDSDFFQLVMPEIFAVTEDNREAALVAANNVNGGRKIAKVIVSEDNVSIHAETLLDSTPVLEDLVPRLLEILLGSRQEFYNQIQ